METQVRTGKAPAGEKRNSVVYVFQGPDGPECAGAAGDEAVARAFAALVERQVFRGREEDCVVWYPDGGGYETLCFVGLGKRSTLTLDTLRRAAGRASKAIKRTKLATVDLPLVEALEEPPAEQARALVEGWRLARYTFTRFKARQDEPEPPEPTVVVTGTAAEDAAALQAGVDLGTLMAEATELARDLINEPAGTLTPSRMAEIAREIAEAGGLELRIKERAELEKEGFGAYLGVAAGSTEPPKFIHFLYKPSGSVVKRVALVGKGLTFDSGGISLKPAPGMEEMKADMAGAAAVFGAMKVISRLAPAAEVHGIVAATENMPDGAAVKPGDVLTSLRGKTIEVLNTDAEGRLTLADALTYAEREGAEEIVDLATLTGACVVALGKLCAGVMGNNQDLIDRLLATTGRTGEKIWQLPLVDEYAEEIKSTVADVKNIGNRWGGAITAGLFLREFVDEKTAWAHMDIAGPMILDKDRPYEPRGGSGVGARTLIAYLRTFQG